jgi:Tfp pilus assembly PilM family ATPase
MSPEAAGTRTKRPGWLSSPPPVAAIEVTSRHVTAVSLAEQGGGPVVSGYGAEAVAPGVLEPALNAPNVHDADALSAAIRSALEKLSPRPRRVALVLPDTVAKVSLVRFEKIPVKREDLDQLIRWQVRKAAPFRIEDAQLSWVPGAALPGGGREFIVTMARRDIVMSYEAACDAAGASAGLIDLASFNLINTVLALPAPAAATPAVARISADDSSTGSGAPRASSRSDWLLVHIATEYATLAVVRGQDLVFFRNRGSSDAAELADLVHQTAMYHEDRLGGGGFSRVIVAGASLRGHDQAEWVRRSVEDRLGTRIETLDFRPAVAMRDRIGAGPELLDALAPALGVLLRERVA